MLPISTAATTFKYERPELDRPKKNVWMCRTDILLATVQVMTKGGETHLHHHKHLDGFWMVLTGHARFYGDGDVLMADIGPNEGVLIPRGTNYWFEAVGSEPLELLSVEAADRALRTADELIDDVVVADPSKGVPTAANLQ